MIFTSPHGSLAIDQDKSIWDMVEERGIKYPNKPAYVDAVTERVLTFADVYQQAKKLCAALAAEGIKKGDVVIVHSMNCLEYPVVLYALTRLSVVCSASSPLFNVNELTDQMQLANATAVITHKALSKTALEAATLSGISAKRVYTMGQAEDALPLTSIEDLIAKDVPFPNLAPVDPEAIVAMPFSSGTTARPKGVELTARAIYSGAILCAYTEKDEPYMLGVLPFFHILATMMAYVGLYRCTAMVVLPRFDPEVFMKVICKYKMRVLHVAPPLVTFLAKHPMISKYDLSHVKFVAAGGAPMGKEVEDAVYKRIGAKCCQGYGMTEFSGPVTMPCYEISRPGSTGQLFPNAQMRIEDLNTGKVLGPNQKGELLVHSPALMKGYYKRPEENEKVFTKDGYVHTGDVGYMDEDGFLFIVDRVKEMIKYKGHQVAPAELEDVLHGHPSIADSCCVRGKDFATNEEIPKAYIVLKEGVKGSLLVAQEIMEFVSAKVAGYKRVRDVEFVDSIPKSLSGKVLRRQLQVLEDKKVQTVGVAA